MTSKGQEWALKMEFWCRKCGNHPIWQKVRV